MIKARHIHGNGQGEMSPTFISPEGWRILAGDNIPGNRLAAWRPGGSPESIVGYLIRPINRIHSIPSHPKSTLARPKSTVDLVRQPLIKVENSLISPLSPTHYRPIIRPENKGIKAKSNRHGPKKFITSHCYSNIPQGDPTQELVSKVLHPICVNSRNSRKKLCASVSKFALESQILILLFSLVHPVEASPTKSNLIHFGRKKHMRHLQNLVPRTWACRAVVPRLRGGGGWPSARTVFYPAQLHANPGNPTQHPYPPRFFIWWPPRSGSK
jgi:hypothetical protein